MKFLTIITFVFSILFIPLHCNESLLKQSADSTNNFNFSMYQKLSTKDGNLFFSPYSISTAVAMTFAGAGSDTKTEIAETMFFGQNAEAVHDSFSRLQKHINDSASSFNALVSANSLWGSKDYTFRPGYLQIINTYYNGAFNILDFSRSDESRAKINAWVEDKTQKLITNLIPERVLNADTKLVLVNALYFKGQWKYGFRERDTSTKSFHLLDGNDKLVPMMYAMNAYMYCETEENKVLEIPYKEDQLSMVIFLPKALDGIRKLEKTASLDYYREQIGRLKMFLVQLTLPRFKLESTFELSEYLKGLGMKKAFSDSADFSSMTEDPKKERLMIDKVFHKCFVDVNEIGTEAAAATAVVMKKPTSSIRSSGPKPLTFKVDRPFMVFIRDLRSGAILFCGRVSDPTPGTGTIITRSKQASQENKNSNKPDGLTEEYFKATDPDGGYRLLGVLIDGNRKFALIDIAGKTKIVTEQELVPDEFKVVSISQNQVNIYNLNKRRQKPFLIDVPTKNEALKEGHWCLTYGKVDVFTLFQLIGKAMDINFVYSHVPDSVTSPSTFTGSAEEIIRLFCQKNGFQLKYNEAKTEYTIYK